ncbi:GNAT family N-acetyltransferase [Priestia koreensis]|uniref:GNAT family acetyltransferase n=1 Tax=Priestia koreensis TaxID=284581 RepID=A0A0M0KYR1_9BACI|nr:GNAT family N-acetyltransferase [Priestia koreensis]KOO43538.1 GNAT family acetyltransferase [Priestia koreensis]
MDVHIRRPSNQDRHDLHHFFELVIYDTYQYEGIGHLIDDINDEIQSKKRYLDLDMKSSGKDRYFLVAELNGQIVGTIEYGPCSTLIQTCTNGELNHLLEVGTVFVHPNHQHKGIGNQLLLTMYAALQNQGLHEFCLDSGYKRAQRIWTKKFGPPTYHLNDYWGKGFPHMIWKVNIKSLT